MPLNVFEEEYWLTCWGFPGFKISSFGRVWDTKFDEEVTQRFLKEDQQMRVILIDRPNEFRGYTWQMMFATFFQSGWGIGVDVAFRDGDPKNLSMFNLLFSIDGKPLIFRLNEETGIWHRFRKEARRVRIVETGEEFATVKELAAAIGGYSNTCYMVLRGQQQTTKGYHLEWAED